MFDLDRPYAVPRRIAVFGLAGYFALLALATAVQPDSYRSTRDFISGLTAMDAVHPAIMIAGFQCAAGIGAGGVLAARAATGSDTSPVGAAPDRRSGAPVGSRRRSDP